MFCSSLKLLSILIKALASFTLAAKNILNLNSDKSKFSNAYTEGKIDRCFNENTVRKNSFVNATNR